MMNHEDFIVNALAEDIGRGDHTSLACIPADAAGKAVLLAKEDGIIAGVELAGLIAAKVDNELVIDLHRTDGEIISKGDKVFHIYGRARSILAAERLILNCMQRMSGIATKTHHLQQKINPYNCRVLDTRKTTPGMREIEKWAVRIGGGSNHRMGLYDMVMIKDNHIDYAGSIRKAIEKTKSYLAEQQLDLRIEIEARNLFELDEILACGQVDRIMLDNFTVHDLRLAVEVIGNRYETEASGGITEESIVKYAETGVNYISVGALTHSVKSLDLSLKAVK